VVAAAVAGTVAESAAEDKSQTERERAGQEAAAMAMAVCLPHTPENEHESDATGVEIMADLGLDLQYADDFFVRMLALYGDGTGSHPKPSERIAKIRAHAAQLEQSGYKPTRVMDRGAFLSMRARVRRLVKDGVESGTIVYWSQEIAQKSQQQALVQPLGCGPLYADPKTVADAFYKSAGVR
jgi:predicted Zn-dependent protease